MNTYYSENEYDFASLYLIFKNYEGCEVTLDVKDDILDFYLIVDFKKTNDDIYDVLDFSTNEDEFVKSLIGDKYITYRYKEFLGVRVFDGFIE